MGQLVKAAAQVEVTPSVHASPGAPAIACKVFAPALPRGWKYRAPPTTGAGFAQWAPYYRVMLPYGGPTLTTTYVPLGEWNSYPYNPETQSFTPRTDANGELIGFWVTTTSYSGELYEDTLNFWYTDGIEHIAFDGWVGDGPPPGPVGATYIGRITRWPYVYEARFTKDSNGFMRALEAFDMPYTTTRLVHGIAAIIDDPGRPPRMAQRAVVETDHRIGWNAGADSEGELDGDVRVVFEPDIDGAGAVGFCVARDDASSYENLSHAFYFDNDPSTGRKRYSVVESGRRVSGYAEYNADVSFEIKREGAYGQVSYLYDGDVVMTSGAPLYSAVRVGTALYRAGDGVL